MGVHGGGERERKERNEVAGVSVQKEEAQTLRAAQGGPLVEKNHHWIG